jgi:hypothetical protein
MSEPEKIADGQLPAHTPSLEATDGSTRGPGIHAGRPAEAAPSGAVPIIESGFNANQTVDQFDSALPGLLFHLLKRTLEKARATIATLPKQLVVYVKPKFIAFDYGNDGNISSTQQRQFEQRAECQLKALNQFVEEVVKKQPEYEQCAEAISAIYGIDSTQCNGHLDCFLNRVIQEPVDSSADETLFEDVIVFIKDLDQSPMICTVTVWLTGLWLENDSYALAKGMKLRRPTPSDFEVEQRLDLALFDPNLSLGWDRPSAILEFACRASFPIDVQQEVCRRLETFRLFRQGSVRHLRYEIKARTFLRLFGGVFGGGIYIGTPYRYKFGQEEAVTFNKFFDTIYDLVPKTILEMTSVEPLEVALHRYREAVLSAVPLENRIALAISCLEALYLKGAERSELTHRLSQRAAALLRSAGKPPIKAYQELARAYDIRSTFIHGSAITDDQRRSADELCKSVLEYARLSAITFLQITETTDKDSFLSRIDNSLLEDRAKRKLEEDIGAVVWQ